MNPLIARERRMVRCPDTTEWGDVSASVHDVMGGRWDMSLCIIST